MHPLKRIYQSLPLVRELRQIRRSLCELHSLAIRQNIAEQDKFLQRTLATPRYADRRKLNHFEFQVFSQNGEDGIIAEIFRRIGIQNKVFVEIGVGNGLENNTAFLLAQGWRGHWIEADDACTNHVRKEFGHVLKTQQLKLLQSFVTAENINSLADQLGVPREIDFLSLDIDRNTSHIWKALQNLHPRVVSIEYNATFPPDVVWEIDYQPKRVWDGTSHFGASLKALEVTGLERGYVLIGCDLSGTNAFFLRRDEALAKFADPFTAENHFEPPRYWLSVRSAHPRGFSDEQAGEL